MIRFVMALLVAMAPMVFGGTQPADDGGPVIDGNDEWQCDGSISEFCNPTP